MFTDDLATPTRLETLLDLMRTQPKKRWDESQVAELLQPDGLPGVKDRRPQAVKMIAAAEKLGLVERGNETMCLTFPAEDERDSRTMLCESLDKHVLGKLDVEPYFAPFYSYVLSLGPDADKEHTRDYWVNCFRSAYPKAKDANPFNETKLTGLRRWYSYAGLGWYDARDVFQCDPYKRLLRRLPKIFGKEKELPAVKFFNQLASACPELDGGDIYRAVIAGSGLGERRCSLGLSRALIELHLDKVLRLHCPSDSDGWSIADADPPRDGADLRSNKVDRITWLEHATDRTGRGS
ncbi:hypothetical protein [Tuwongella immobilis]|uniref:Uncharacterized protein n=1 Tax=Tuwongella immobilis TaxID=692036 RepID=A0A6C2YWY6_9BACT|nr:hypothetical protein [Tuwongella immobilis]VIP05335.1 Uncharacterized protein OS=Mesorhizobium sp. LNJC405B00 GN=X755_06930 PE=4 SV=1 [Tuwongella immobilis]VTS08026.1 Uncharacterized protein OS=Mesorhizobium sp. LNJC405B00 GN=X755_06930 PE=4 SV=1 [Tuwongella immobilis]